MRKIYFTEFKFKEKYLYFSIIISFLIIAYYHLNLGFHMSPDSFKFSRAADDLIKSNLNLFDFYFSNKSGSQRITPIFFTIPILLTAICKILFGHGWHYGFLLFNLMFVLFSIIIFVRTLLIIQVRPLIILLTLPLIIVSVDLLTWPRYILADTIYSLFVILSIYFIAKGLMENKYNYYYLFLIIFLMLLTRPTSLPVIGAIILFITLSKYQFLLRLNNILLFIVIPLILLPLVFTILYLFIEFNFSTNAQLDFWLLSKVKAGMIIHDRPETWVDSPKNFKDIFTLFFLRLIYFFNPYAINFSKIHIILNVFQSFIFLLSIIIWFFLKGITENQDKLFFFIVLLSFSVASFHSFTLIDFDWRYRFPVIMPLIMLFPISIEMILKKNNKI